MRKKLFSTIDPLGNTITLFEDTLNKHISVRHPNMKFQHEAIRLAIEQPIIIGHSKKSKDTLLFLGTFSNKEQPFLIVAVKKVKNYDRIILTAFSTKNIGIQKIETILWQNKKKLSTTHTLLSLKN